jgi:hypothetical protein
MPKKARELSAIDVKRLAHPGNVGNVNVPVGGVSYSPTLGQIFVLFKLLPSSADRFQCC